MRQINSIIFDLIVINTITKIFCQSSSKNFITFLNYSSEDNLYYIGLFLDENKTPKKFFIDTTFPLVSFYNINNTAPNVNYSKDDDCFINTTIIINNTINNNKDNIEISFNTDIKYINEEEKLFKSKIDGVLGLNNAKNNTFIDILYNLNIIDEKIFSICLSNKKGYLGLGKIIRIDEYLDKQKEINFINILTSLDNLFELKTNYIKINSIKIEQEFISYLDTSKSHTFFPKNLYEQIITYLLLNKNNLKKDFLNGFCQIINKEEKNNFYNNFPDIIINFDNLIFIWKSINYFYELENSTDNINEVKLCLTFNELNDDDINKDKIILGTDFMQDYEIVFDKDNQKIAFINTDCDNLFLNDNNKVIINTNNIYGNSTTIFDNIENMSSINEISEISDNFLNSSFTTEINKEKKYDENLVALMGDNISDISNSNNYLINTETESDLLINDSYIDYITDYSTNIIIDSTNEKNIISDKIYETLYDNNNKITTTDGILSPTTQNINDINNKKEIINIDTTENIKKIETTIIKEKAEVNIIETTVLKIPKTINEEEKINETEIKMENEGINNNTQINNQHITKNAFYEVVKSFLKNKLIYFFLAFLGIVFAFVSIIFISCALISCVKYIQSKRRDYMEQVDVELPRYSKNISSFSDDR